MSDSAEEAAVTSIGTVAILGNGGWGTALGIVAERNGASVRIWGVDAEYVAETARSRENPRYLKGVSIPERIVLTSDAHEAFDGADLLLSVVPTQLQESVRLQRWRIWVLSLCAGSAMICWCAGTGFSSRAYSSSSVFCTSPPSGSWPTIWRATI